MTLPVLTQDQRDDVMDQLHQFSCEQCMAAVCATALEWSWHHGLTRCDCNGNRCESCYQQASEDGQIRCG